MAEEPTSGAPDPQALLRDWITLWNSEMAALATDRELREWAETPRPDVARDPSGRPGPAAPPGSAAAAAAHAAGSDAELERLGRRVAELERRLAELERSR